MQPHHITKYPNRFTDMLGRRFGRLVVTRYAGIRKRNRSWECVCDCGNTTVVLGTLLRNGKTRSCGCLQIIAATKHGMRYVPEYRIWKHMRGRCLCPSDKSFDRYGGRDISICQRWYDSFENFYADMGPRPSPKHSIDRIDNMSGYSPENCRWATAATQANNRRSNHLITYNGQTRTITEWEQVTGIKSATLRKRLKLGWTIQRTLTMPIRERR